MISNPLSLEPFPQPELIPLDRPVVLMHGIGIFAAMGRKGQLHQQAMNLRRYGVRAYAPNVVPYDRIPVRAQSWKNRIEEILRETGADRVHLIAHSMGGLDGRYLISRLDGHDDVETLTTISTPHRGSAIAARVIEQPERVRRWITEVMNWLGETAYANAPADALSAIGELTPEHVREEFNPGVPDHPSVRYRSYAGRAGKGTSIPINPFLVLYNTALFEKEGINDGFVSVESARWGEFKGILDADHGVQVGLKRTPGASFEPEEFYLSIVRALADPSSEARPNVARSTDSESSETTLSSTESSEPSLPPESSETLEGTAG